MVVSIGATHDKRLHSLSCGAGEYFGFSALRVTYFIILLGFLNSRAVRTSLACVGSSRTETATQQPHACKAVAVAPKAAPGPNKVFFLFSPKKKKKLYSV